MSKPTKGTLRMNKKTILSVAAVCLLYAAFYISYYLFGADSFGDVLIAYFGACLLAVALSAFIVTIFFHKLGFALQLIISEALIIVICLAIFFIQKLHINEIIAYAVILLIINALQATAVFLKTEFRFVPIIAKCLFLYVMVVFITANF